MGRNGEPESFKGTSLEVIVDEALTFIKNAKTAGKPFRVSSPSVSGTLAALRGSGTNLD